MLNWAIHGTGFISHAMITAIAASNGSRVHTIIGRNPETLAEFQTQYAIPNTATDAAQPLADPEIDAIYIALPNHLHHTATIAASNAGKAVLCEKSLTTTMEQADALATTIRTNNTFFAEGLMYLAHPLYARLTELLLDGRLGKLRAIHGHYAADIHGVTNPLGRGTLFNLGCYPVSLMHLVIQTMCGPDAFANRTLLATGNTRTRSRHGGRRGDDLQIRKRRSGYASIHRHLRHVPRLYHFRGKRHVGAYHQPVAARCRRQSHPVAPLHRHPRRHHREHGPRCVLPSGQNDRNGAERRQNPSHAPLPDSFRFPRHHGPAHGMGHRHFRREIA